MNGLQLDIRRGLAREVAVAIRRRRTSGVGVRMAPMIDVVFLLLTFFILTFRFRTPEEFLPITFPSPAQARQIGIVEPLEIRINARAGGCAIAFGTIDRTQESVIDAKTLDADLLGMAAQFVEVLKSQHRTINDPVVIICGDDVPWDYLVKIYNVFHSMGINDVTFGMIH